LRKEMQLELKALQEQVGITFIYVTHDQEEALTMSNRIAVMSRGKALQIGSSVEIYERPNCRFVADFIGETNFLTGVVKKIDKNQVTVQVANPETEVIGIGMGNLTNGQTVAVSIRPEKVRLVDADGKGALEPESGENHLYGRVTATAYIGSDTRVVIEVGSSLHIKVWEQNAVSTLDPDMFYSVGDAVKILIPYENTLVLPEDIA
jgi:spermidine/putrescine transport system ATP-binding protein